MPEKGLEVDRIQSEFIRGNPRLKLAAFVSDGTGKAWLDAGDVWSVRAVQFVSVDRSGAVTTVLVASCGAGSVRR